MSRRAMATAEATPPPSKLASEWARADEAYSEGRGNLPAWAMANIPAWDRNDPVQNALGVFMVDKEMTSVGDLITLKAIRDFNRRTEAIVEDWRDMSPDDPERAKSKAEWVKRRTQGRARVKWWHQQLAAIRAEQARRGIAALFEAEEAAAEREYAIETAIQQAPAHGAKGVAVKLRLALRLQGVLGKPEGDMDWADRVVASALRDLDRLAGGAARQLTRGRDRRDARKLSGV